MPYIISEGTGKDGFCMSTSHLVLLVQKLCPPHQSTHHASSGAGTVPQSEVGRLNLRWGFKGRALTLEAYGKEGNGILYSMLPVVAVRWEAGLD